MAVERQHGNIMFTCDGKRCNEFNDSCTSSWNDAIHDLKLDGWLVTREDDEWQHYCKDCKNDNNR